MENIEISREKQEALELHQQIMISANTAVNAYVETCKGLKKMRDTKLYVQLGYESFEDYTETAVGIKQRQAYYYISTLEKLGEQFLQSNANLGPSKLALLTEIPMTEREEIVAENDLGGMTVEQVKELVAQNDAKGEQITMLERDIDHVSRENDQMTDDLKEAKDRIAELEDELEEERNRPAEVAVREPSAEELEQIRAEAKKEAEKEAKKKIKELKDKIDSDREQAVNDAKALSEQELADYKDKVAAADAARAEAIARAEKLEKQLAVSSSPEATRFTFYFEALQGDLNKIRNSLSAIEKENTDTAEKYKAAIKKYLQLIGAQFGIEAEERETANIVPDTESSDLFMCSACHNIVMDQTVNYCDECGRKLVKDDG